MSENIKPFNLAAAQKYNSKVDLKLFDEMLDAEPTLSTRRDGQRFATAVYEFQKACGLSPHECDGKLGRQTYGLLVGRMGAVNERVIFDGAPLIMPRRDEYKLVTFDERDGLDLHRYGNFSPRKGEVSGVCVHWGGLNAQHCFNVFASPARKVSSHFLIGLVDGCAVVYQVLDIKHKAWHGGKVNDFTVGVDICQQAGVQWADHYEDGGYDLTIINNPSTRGERKVLSLHPALRTAAALFIKDLMNALSIPLKPAPDADGIYEDDVDKGRVTLFGHSHVNRRKWDIAPYWAGIIDVIERGDSVQ
jgi:hypothetical protein